MTRRPAPLTPLLAGVTGALSVTTVVLTWAAGAGVRDFLAENLANTWLAGLSAGAVAVLIARSQPGHPLGRVFAVAGVTAAASAAATAYADLAFAGPARWPLADAAAWVAGVFWMPAFLLLLVAVPLLFPRGALPSPRWRWPARVALATGLVAITCLALTDGLVTDVQPEARNPWPTPVPDRFLLPPAVAGFFVTIAVGVAATVAVAVRMRRLDGAERQQNAWFVAAVAAVLLVTWLPVPAVVTFLGNGLFVVALGVAIVRYHLFDIELALSRAVVYGLLTAGALAVYLAVVLVLGVRVGGGVWPALVTAGAALGLGLLAGRLQRVVERALYGDRHDPLVTLTRLGERLGSTVAAEDVLPAVTDTARRSLRAPYAAVELAGEETPAYASGSPTEVTERFALSRAGEDFGALVVGVRRGESRLSAADRRLVTAFAHQAAVAVHDARVARELKRSRERIVVAREEERRRLRRNLHDGVGPALAGISLGLETAERAAARGDVGLPGLVMRLRSETDLCTREVRQIVADLRPASLDSIGLVEALRQHAELLTSRSGNGFRVSVEGESPRDLSAAVEVAAYRIVLEALTNTVRHARAHTSTVVVSERNGLRLQVSDDGTGLPDAPPGVGLTSMRDRAEEVGGVCMVTFTEGVGTNVEAVLPIGAQLQAGRP